ncbi:hypothetical protein [Bdellovibrio bacteriovorus]|uniref:hypothetical protein n=1 Tax=Bdellovibrio bacteriovorus TaxID=959 RepID=UPI003D053869
MKMSLAFFLVLFSMTVAESAPAVSHYQISTEDYPPYNHYDKNKSIVGLATNKVRKIMETSGFQYEIRLYPWLRAYNRALSGARQYVIGGLEGDASLSELKRQGFKTESVVTNWLNKDKLVGQRIQLWIDDPVYIDFEKQKGTEFFDYVKVVHIASVDLFLACNISTPLNEVELLHKSAGGF